MGIVETATELLQQAAIGHPLFHNEVILAALVFVVTASAVGLCVPGLLMPISFTAGMLMESWLAIPIVAAGAMLGSHALFLLARTGMRDTLERRFGDRVDRFRPHIERYGVAYTAGLRIIGTPHVLVTLASAAGRLRHGSFALASFLGFLPAIALSVGAASAI